MAATVASFSALQPGTCAKLQALPSSVRLSTVSGTSLRCHPAHRLGGRCQATKPGVTETTTSSEKVENGSAATPTEGLNLNFIPPPDAPVGSFNEVMAFSGASDRAFINWQLMLLGCLGAMAAPLSAGLTSPFLADGPAPEVINGRLAMWGFLYAAIGELSQGQTIGEQFLASPVTILSTVVTVSLASFVPMLISDVPFKELLETATAAGMPPQLKVFNYPVEKWTGRVAMLAFVIFLLIEAVSGQATFSLLKSAAGL